METRRAKRIGISTKVKLKVDSSLTERFNIPKENIETEALDISVLGIGLLSKFFIPKGVIVNLQLKVSNKVVNVKGEIKSAISGGKGLTRLGIQFIGVDKYALNIIDKFIKDNERRSEPRLELP